MGLSAKINLASASGQAGAVCVLARKDDSEILVVHGNSRKPDIAVGERTARVEWFSSIEVAEAISHFCSEKLCQAFPADKEGWHPYAVANFQTLLNLAKNHLNVTLFPREPKGRRRAWSKERSAWLGYLVGQGWDAKAIADDPFIGSTANNVHQQVNKLGLSFAKNASAHVVLKLSADLKATYTAAASRQGMQCETLMRRTLMAASDSLPRGSVLSTFPVGQIRSPQTADRVA